MTRSYDSFFQAAMGTNNSPYAYQEAFATNEDLPALVDIPTGLGKTAAVILGWIWRRRFHPDRRIRQSTPRRLVYCLPMRVLVEQTVTFAENCIKRLVDSKILDQCIRVHALMGGEAQRDWCLWPEREAILIGTQDMLLSRALNRGYAASRYRWPVEFGLLSNDCLWVYDEVQLMDAGVPTSAQLAAFRQSFGTVIPSPSLWMSATLDRRWLATVDFTDTASLKTLQLTQKDRQHSFVAKRLCAPKRLRRAKTVLGDAKGAAQEIQENHAKATRTLAVFNTVKRATDVYRELRKLNPKAKTVLIHSRFRPPERKQKMNVLLGDPPNEGLIAITTQVIEAGVDVSAKTLFTDLAPWSSLVQRFGRCNRAGEFRGDDPARVFWFDLPADDEEKKLALPYSAADLHKARRELEKCEDVSPDSLSAIQQLVDLDAPHVIRRRDFIDLFDTTPDLAGNDIDVSRFIRSGQDFDVQVYWRDWEQGSPPDDRAWRRVRREELCSVPVGDFRKFAVDAKRRTKVWRWDFLDGEWRPVVDGNLVYPGQTYLVHAKAGGYDSETGWIGTQATNYVEPRELTESDVTDDSAYDDEGLSEAEQWQTIAEHTDQVVSELEAILQGLALEEPWKQTLLTAARWHDWGKAHEVFLAKFKPEALAEAALASQNHHFPAKAPKGCWRSWQELRKLSRQPVQSHVRPHFRHELASALAVLQRPHPSLDTFSSTEINLVAYLVAAHHGKVRLSIRSLPGEKAPLGNSVRLHARGVWDGDQLPQVDLGGGVTAPVVTLSLECMQLGRSANGQPSWVERMIKLRDDPNLGPFRLAFLEALLRAADMRASRLAAERAAQRQEATT